MPLWLRRLMEDKILRNIFDPGWFSIKTNSFDSEETKNKKMLNRSEFEKLAYEEITQGLTNDLTELGITINYATKIIIGELAFDLILFSRLKFHTINRNLTREIVQYKPWMVKPSERVHNTKVTEYSAIDSTEEMHPIYDDFIFKLQKNINKLLALVHLLPGQQMQQQKLVIIQKMKERLLDIEQKSGAYSVTAVAESKQEIDTM